MIQTLSKLGALYKHEEYQTLSTLWNTYPWVLGSDNKVEQEIELEDFYSDKTIFEEEENLSSFLFNIENFIITATLISIDNLGNFGKAVVNPPNINNPPKELMRNVGITGVSFLNMVALESLLIRDSNSESEVNRSIGITGVLFKNMTAEETLLVRDSNSEGILEPKRVVGITDVSFKNITMVEV